jgi:pyruvate formate lyase activating enzyme
MAPHIDVLCSDIKSMRDDFYRDICRPARVEQVLHAIRKAHDLGIHVETRTNIIPGKNDDPEEHYEIACWVRDNLGKDSPWHITRFFPAYKLSNVPPTPEETLFKAREAAERAGLQHVYVYNDKGCDCAAENRSVEFYLDDRDADIHQVKKCAAGCCGEQGVLLKKYEQNSTI